MNKKTFKNYYIFSVAMVLLISIYPLYMGVRVVSDMITQGTVLGADYPKYVIPYTPISLAVISGVLLLPILIKYAGRFALLAATCISTGIFFLSELLLESQVIVTTTLQTTLESWQMYMCYIPPELYETRRWRAVDVLIGEYSPAYKIHFYIISLVLILSFLNCFYGFGQMIKSGNRSRLKILILQAVSSVLFLGLCILACFTAFFRTGDLYVSPISAVLMSIFFVIFGVTMGIYAVSFLGGKKKWIRIAVSSGSAMAVTLIMYIGEMILLNGHLYRFGRGILFEGFAGVVLAPIDILLIVLSGCIAGVLGGVVNIGRSGSGV